MDRKPKSQITNGLKIDHIAAGGIWVLSGRIANTLFALGIIALLARSLDASEMGAYVLAVSVVSVFSVVGQFGLHQAALRLVAEGMTGNEHRFVRQVVRNAILIAGGCGLCLAVGLNLGLADWIGYELFEAPGLAQASVLLGIWTLMLILQTVIAEVFRGFQDYRRATIHGGLTSSLFALGALIFLQLSEHTVNLHLVLTVITSAALLGVIWSALSLAAKIHGLGLGGYRHASLRGLASITWPLWISSVAMLLSSHADLWILGALSTQEQVAVYGTAARISVLLSVPLFVVNSVITPLIARLNVERDLSRLQSLLQATASVAAIPAVVLLPIFALFGEEIMTFIFGNGYGAGGNVLIILSIGHAANVLSGSCGYTLIMTGHQQIMMRISLVSTSLLLLAGLLLAGRYAAQGVALAFTGSLILQNVLMWIFARRKCGVSTHAVPWRVFHWLDELRSAPR